MMTFSPILMRIGYGLSWQSAVVAAWGGLRGAVGLALALQVYIDHPLIGGKVCIGYGYKFLNSVLAFCCLYKDLGIKRNMINCAVNPAFVAQYCKRYRRNL